MNRIITINDAQLIGEGATRRCYNHPEERNKCLKVMKRTELNENVRDLAAYKRVVKQMQEFIPYYEPELIQTNMGLALVSELIIDLDDTPSKSYAYYWTHKKIPPQIYSQLDSFFDAIQSNDFFFYDLNPKNFLIQQIHNGHRLRYTDLKSLGHNRTLFSIEKIRCFARKKMHRRILRFKIRYMPSSSH